MTTVAAVLCALHVLAAPPTPLTGSARDAAFPKGDETRAQELNKTGLALRKKGDSVGAGNSYIAAVRADQSYAPARYNLACELARSGQVSLALEQLAELVHQGTPSSLKYVAAARYDEDFKSIWRDLKFAEIQSIFSFDTSKPTLAQICANPGKVVPLIADDVGLVVHLDDRDRPDNATVLQTKVVRGRDARAAAYKMLDDGVFCSNGKPAQGEDVSAVKDFALNGIPNSGLVCYERAAFMEYDSDNGMCFGIRKGQWMLALVVDIDGTAGVDESSGIAQRRVKPLQAAAAKAAELLQK